MKTELDTRALLNVKELCEYLGIGQTKIFTKNWLISELNGKKKVLNQKLQCGQSEQQ